MSTKKTAFKSDFGLNLKMARKEGGWNQEELAAELGISRDTLSRYERGELSPSLEVFSKMFNLFAAIDIDAVTLLSETTGKLKTKDCEVIGSWGWAKGLNFASGGAFRVGAAYTDILRLTDELIKKLPEDNPFSKVTSEIKQYIYDLEDSNENQDEQIVNPFELWVPIARHAVSFQVEVPDASSSKVDKVFMKYLEEKAKVEKLQAKLDKLEE